MLPGTMQNIDYFCHLKRYKAQGGRKRTMIVVFDYKPVGGYKYKGIITAYWAPGHRGC